MSSQAQSKYESALLKGWEEVYKKSVLSLWILLALKESPKYMEQIKDFIEQFSKETISADDKSMYRALRRFCDSDMAIYVEKPSNSGPNKKLYSLSQVGQNVLKEFTKRNIVDTFFNPKLQKLLY